MRRMTFLLIALVLAGCVPHPGASGRDGSLPPTNTTVEPGQSLTLRLEDGGTTIATAGQPYISALGEPCVRVSEHASLGAACLRGGEWIGLPDIFLSRPVERAMP